VEYLFAFLLGSCLIYVHRGVPWLLAGLRELHRARLLARLSRRKRLPVREVREGPVRLRGRVGAVTKLLVAPESAQPCVAYEARAGWLGGVEVASTAFELSDGTGVVRVEAEQPALLVREESGVMGDRMRLVCPGDVVTVYGVAAQVPDPTGPTAGYRSSSLRMVVGSAPGQRMLIVRHPIWGMANVAIGAGALASAAALVVFMVLMWQ
jgi:hypothetical protein